MKRISSTIILFTLALLPVLMNAQNKKTTTDHLSIPGPVSFSGQSYKLSWSSHPSADYYKQEYLPAGEAADKYKTMLMFDVLTGDQSAKDLAAAKIEELKQMKQNNPMVNYNIFNNAASGEYMIDFLLTANAADGSITILERNVYRYKQLTAIKGVLLFGVSKRAYGKDVDTFLQKMKATKNELVDAVAKFSIPAISIKK